MPGALTHYFSLKSNATTNVIQSYFDPYAKKYCFMKHGQYTCPGFLEVEEEWINEKREIVSCWLLQKQSLKMIN